MVKISQSGPLDYARYVFSAILFIFSGIMTTYSIFEQRTTFWNEIPGWAGIIIFVGVLFWLGIVEGLLLALVEVKRLDPESYKDTYPRAYKFMEIVNKGDNLQKFIMGRQVVVVVLSFLAAKLTCCREDDDDFMFPIPSWFHSIGLETGLLASILVVILGQLMPQIVASLHPLAFAEIWLMKPTFYLCLFLEMTGIIHICWVLSSLLTRCLGLKKKKKVGVEEGKEDEKKGSSEISNPTFIPDEEIKP